MIQEIKALIRQPSSENLVEVGENLTVIKNIDLHSLEKELGIKLSTEIREQIQKVNNYQQLSSVRNQVIKSYSAQKQDEKISNQNGKEVALPFKNERVVWISLLVVSLMVIGGLVGKLKRTKQLTHSKRT